MPDGISFPLERSFFLLGTCLSGSSVYTESFSDHDLWQYGGLHFSDAQRNAGSDEDIPGRDGILGNGNDKEVLTDGSSCFWNPSVGVLFIPFESVSYRGGSISYGE